jgi:hypothetical protein
MDGDFDCDEGHKHRDNEHWRIFRAVIRASHVKGSRFYGSPYSIEEKEGRLPLRRVRTLWNSCQFILRCNNDKKEIPHIKYTRKHACIYVQGAMQDKTRGNTCALLHSPLVT